MSMHRMVLTQQENEYEADVEQVTVWASGPTPSSARDARFAVVFPQPRARFDLYEVEPSMERFVSLGSFVLDPSRARGRARAKRG